ncbi:MAG: hypothetical protein SVR94_14285, partial [Pseudomonadota bacterium]|nr:hypothetical protein [Pseudomonadota bacterium]
MLLEKLFENRFLLGWLISTLLLTSIVQAQDALRLADNPNLSSISCNTQSKLIIETPDGQLIVPIEWGQMTVQGHYLPAIRHILLGNQQGQIDLYDDGIIDIHYHHCQQLSVSLSTIDQFIIELPKDNWVLEQYSGETLDAQLRAVNQTTTLLNLPDDALIIDAQGGQLTLNALNALQTHVQIDSKKRAPFEVNIEAALSFDQLAIQANSLHVNAPITTQGSIEMGSYATQDNPAELMINATITAPAVYLDSADALWVDSSIKTIGAQGGWIQLRAADIYVLNGAQLEASGDSGGGHIVIGDQQQPARYIVIEPQAKLRSDALLQGDGGHIIIDSQQATIVHGHLSAQGGYLGGDGGFVETSSQGSVLTVTTAPQLSAVAGQDGTWLLDPYNIEIVAGLMNANVDITAGVVLTAIADNAQIGVDL